MALMLFIIGKLLLLGPSIAIVAVVVGVVVVVVVSPQQWHTPSQQVWCYFCASAGQSGRLESSVSPAYVLCELSAIVRWLVASLFDGVDPWWHSAVWWGVAWCGMVWHSVA